LIDCYYVSYSKVDIIIRIINFFLASYQIIYIFYINFILGKNSLRIDLSIFEVVRAICSRYN